MSTKTNSAARIAALTEQINEAGVLRLEGYAECMCSEFPAAATADDARDRRAGATACLVAVRKLIEAANTPCGPKAEDYFNQQLENAKAVATALGPMPAFLEGAILSLAEYIHVGETTGGPNLEPGGWVPLSAMTDAERQAQIDRMNAYCEADKTARVIQLAEWRPAS
jgi:hypothetical protein